MNKLGNFLWKLFSITMVLSWDARGVAMADDETTTKSTDTRWGIYSHSKKGHTKTICPAGQYVYSCGSYKVGYNWLKNITLTAPNGWVKSTKNYYIGDSTYDRMEQLHAFFNKNQTIKQTTDTGYTSVDTSSSEVEDDREFILGLVCNPLTENISITCAACPDGGTVERSSVDVGNDTSYEETDLMLIRGTWNFHTIADCYVSEFEDASGSFVYVSPNVSATDAKAEACYYVNTKSSATNFLAGDNLYGFIAGSNAGTITTVTPDIPE